MSDPVTFRPVPGSTVSVAVTTSSNASNPIGQAGDTGPETVRLLSSVNTCITVGANPTAQTTHMELIAGVAEYFDVIPGEKIAAVRAPSATADGTLKITRMQKRTY